MDGASTVWLIGLGGAAAGAAITAIPLLVRRARDVAALTEARTERAMLSDQVESKSSVLFTVEAERDALRDDREAAVMEAAALEERLSASERRREDERKILEDAKTSLLDAFAALGANALQTNNEQFMRLAKTSFEKIVSEARGDVEQRRQAIDAMVKPLRELMEKQNTAVTDLERKRDVAYRGLEEQIKGIAHSHERLNAETTRLVTALRRPEQRGRWGEMQLRNVVELAGMTNHCDFVEQVTVGTDDDRQRPDMVVNLPGEGVIVVDSKVSLSAYLDALDPEADHAAAMSRHVRHVAEHVRALAAKQYWNQFERTPKVVVMFVPLEAALTAALEIEPDLHAKAMKNHVLIATPTLLVALLRAVAYGWQQEDVAANAREIAQVGRELYDRLATYVKNVEKVGMNLDRSVKAYNAAVGSLESRVLPSTRDLKRLHATTEKVIETPSPIEVEVRPVTAAELKPSATWAIDEDAVAGTDVNVDSDAVTAAADQVDDDST